MRSLLTASLLAITCLCCSPCFLHAGEYNEVLSVGDVAPAWKQLPGTDGREHNLSDLQHAPVVVVVFTCVSCPTARDYEDRINALARQFSGADSKVAVVAICVNKVPEDQLPALKAHQQEKQLQFHYLSDETQQIARDYGAIFTPQFFVLNAERKIVYMGAMDDATNPTQVRQNYVFDAVTAALNGKAPAVTETIARGCRIRFVNPRRSTKN